jgi:hypothetical protein
MVSGSRPENRAELVGAMTEWNFQLHLGIEGTQTLTVVSVAFGSQAKTSVILVHQHLWGVRTDIFLVPFFAADALIDSALAIFWNRDGAMAQCYHSGRVFRRCCLQHDLDVIKISVPARRGIF